VKEVWCRVITTERPPYAKNDKTCLMRCDLQLIGYTQGFINSVINSKGSSRLNKEQKPWAPCISHIWRVFQRSSNV
jgi:hypothetical protein